VPDSTQSIKEDFVTPATATELALTQIFAEVLHMKRVGATADHLRLGADSIQLFQITARANRSGMKITAKQLLQHRNAAALGALIDTSAESTPATSAVALPSLGEFKRSRRSGQTARN
jgi:aryl carrier-like protein